MLKDTLITIASKVGKNTSTIFSEFLDYTIAQFNPSGEPLSTWPYAGNDEVNRLFFMGVLNLMREYNEGITRHGWCDPLGETFMSLLGKYDTQRNGVFFTPVDVSNLMAQLTDKSDSSSLTNCGAFGQRQLCGDPTCGSGRNLLSYAAKYANKPRADLPYFIGEDVDEACVKMTAINLMAHGLPGEVICHNTLSEPDSLSIGYIINEGLFPFTGGLPSIRRFTDPNRFVLFRARSATKQQA